MRVAVAEDSVLFREGLVRVLRSEGFDVVAEAGDAAALYAAVTAQRPDVVVVDVRMPPTHSDEGLIAAIHLHGADPGLGVLVLSHHVETHHAERLLADDPGGVGYLLKDRIVDLADFVEAVRRVGAGGSVIDPEVVRILLSSQRRKAELAELSGRELDVLGLMAEGRTNAAIAERLHLGTRTVETHVTNIFTKLGLLPAEDDHRRVLAVLVFLRASAG